MQVHSRDQRPPPTMPRQQTKPPLRTYTISLAHRKARGSGHERLPEILAAARNLFAELGVENVTTKQIAARVGISQAALFGYYRNKDEIFARLMQDAFADLAGTLDEIDREATDAVDWLRRLIEGYIAFGLARPDEYRLALMVIKRRGTPGEATAPTDTVLAIAYPLFQRLERKIAEAMEAGRVRQDPGSPGLVAQALWASIHGLTALLIARPRPNFPWDDRQSLIRAQTEMLLQGILSSVSHGSSG